MRRFHAYAGRNVWLPAPWWRRESRLAFSIPFLTVRVGRLDHYEEHWGGYIKLFVWECGILIDLERSVAQKLEEAAND